VMPFVRTWMPLLICAAGVVIFVVRGFDETGGEALILLVAAGSSVWLLNVLFRLGVRGDVERDAEDDARAFFDRHGYWPDEAPPGGAPEPAPPEHGEHRPGGPHAEAQRLRGHGSSHRRRR
jgi:hypothetical protein